jgi:5'(3')-deoxyribonucleotidase
MSSIFNLISNRISIVSTGISPFKNLVGKAESVLKFIGFLDHDMVLVDLLIVVLDILIDDILDEIIDGISRCYFL